MTTKTFTNKQLREWGFGYKGVWSEHAIDSEIVSSDGIEGTVEAIVFKSPEDGKCWRFEYQYMHDYTSFDFDEHFEAVEVEPYEVTVTKWREAK